MESSFLSDVFLPLALFVIMLGMGLSLSVSDFGRVVKYPKAIVLGLFNQLVLLPIVGFGIAIAFELPGELAVGLMLLAACPGGATSNLITHLAKGDTALSITLTAISSLLTIVTIPLVVGFSLDFFLSKNMLIELDVPKTLLQLVVITIVPVSIGMVVNAKSPSFSKRMEKPVKILSATFLALVIVGLLVKERANVLAFFQQVGLSALLLNLSTMLLGFVMAWLFKLNSKWARTISIESGIQNGTLAIVIASTILQNSTMAVPPAIYSLIMFVTGGLLVFWFIRKDAKEQDVELLA